MLIIDFETRSRCDLKLAGTYNYIADPTTDIICLAAHDNETGTNWLWYPGDPLPGMLIATLRDADFIGAHYAEFDMGIYEYIAVGDYGFPEIPHNHWYCTSAQMRVNNLPGGLDEAAWALGLSDRKHPVGGDLIKKLSIPQEDGTFNRDPKLIKQMGNYCMQDVNVTTAIVAATRPMTQIEWQDWYKNVEINERGVKVDLRLAKLALQYADAEQGEIAVELKEATNGAVEKHTQNIRIKDWIVGHCGYDHPILDMMTVYKKDKKKLSLDKAIRSQIIGEFDAGSLLVDENIIYVIELLDDGNKSSVAKFKKMLTLADPDDHRVRGAFMFAGASQTLRYASRGLQLHNMRRECWSAEETEDIILRMARARTLLAVNDPDMSVMETLAKLLRPALIPEDGHVFVVGDWKAIEAMVLPWLTDTDEGDDKLEVFTRGEDVYIKAATEMKLLDMDDHRQIGKVAELACGFGGGYRAFQGMARNFGLAFSQTFAQRIVDKWRDNNRWCVKFWADLDRAAKAAICLKGTVFSAGMVDYYFDRKIMGGTLQCILPGEHVIQYPKARIEKVMAPWGKEILSITCMKASYSPKADQKAWPRAALYGGLLAENATQGFAACILRNANRQLPDIVAHVHDEIVMEVPEEVGAEAAGMLKSVMVTVPEWADGLPLAADPVIMTRYGKG